MFIKLLSGDLIELDGSDLKEIKSRLASLTNTPTRYLTLLDPETGEPVSAHMIDTAYLYSYKHDLLPDPDLAGWEVSQRTSPYVDFDVCSLFTPVGFRRVKPALDLEEFRRAVQGKSIQIQEAIDDEALNDYPLSMFMIDCLHPAFMLDYLPLLDAAHFSGCGDPLFHLLTNAHLDNHREEDEEFLLLLFQRMIPRFGLPVLNNAYRMAMYHDYPSIVRYFLELNPDCSR